jgi:hypothetical protein
MQLQASEQGALAHIRDILDTSICFLWTSLDFSVGFAFTLIPWKYRQHGPCHPETVRRLLPYLTNCSFRYT